MTSTDAQTMPFAVELLMRIFKEVEKADRYPQNNILNFRRACKHFDDIVVAYFFKKGVDLGYRYRERPCGNINRMGVIGALRRYPHLAQDIRRVFFRSPSERSTTQADRFWLHDQPCTQTDLWANNSPLLQLPNVQTMRLEMIMYRVSKYNAEGVFCFGARALLGYYLHIGTLTTLSISHMEDIPIPDILSSRSLLTVEFKNCTFSEYVPSSGATERMKDSSLVSLSVRRSSGTGVSFPISFLSNLPKIEKIEILNVFEYRYDFPDKGGFYSGPVTPRTRQIFHHLSDLAVENLNDWCILCPLPEDHAEDASPFPALRKLTFNLIIGTQGLANLPILSHIPSLKELTFRNLGSFAEDFQDRELHLVDHILKYRKSLESLTFQVEAGYNAPSNPFSSPLDQIVSALASLACDNVLERIRFDVAIEIPHVRGPFSPNTENLASIATLLCRPGAFPSLNRVALHGTVYVHEDVFKGEKETTQTLHSTFSPALSPLMVSKDIQFSLTTTYYKDSCNSMCWNSDEEEDEDDEGDGDEGSEEGEEEGDEDAEEEDGDDDGDGENGGSDAEGNDGNDEEQGLG
ncbi:hypothetical protein BJ165DRAFT_1598023 [Panaeolus papilionaceus]|nr:hypothetical protein BJ165DRAFT_1598023 [Panaeolus papilionaceus]